MIDAAPGPVFSEGSGQCSLTRGRADGAAAHGPALRTGGHRGGDGLKGNGNKLFIFGDGVDKKVLD